MSGTFSRRQILQAAALGVGAAAFSAGLPPPRAVAAGGGPAGAILEEWQIVTGTLIQAGSNFLDLALDGGDQRFSVLPGASAWRGGEMPVTSLQAGDDTMVRLGLDGTINRAWSNLVRYLGTAHSNGDGTWRLETYSGSTFGLTFAPTATNSDGVPMSASNLSAGDDVDVTALEETPGTLLATTLDIGTLNPTVATDLPDENTGFTESIFAPGTVPMCVYTYNGMASWFYCSGGAGRCGTCSTSKTNQIAWPALDSQCTGCTTTCCNCSGNCKGQVQLSCGYTVTVVDLCTGGGSGNFTIADCGPYLVTSAGNRSTVCFHKCTLCGRNAVTPIVDLTRQSFARFYDPAKISCFPAHASTRVPC